MRILYVLGISLFPALLLCQPVPSSPPDASTNQPMNVELRWRPTGSAMYEVHLFTQASAEPVQVLYTAGMAVRAENLAWLTEHTWMVRGLDSGMAPGAWSAPRTFVTEALGGRPEPTLPENEALDVAYDATPAPLLVWNDPAPGATWEIQFAATDTLDDVAPIRSGTTFYAPTLQPATHYTWRVRRMSAAGGPGPWSYQFRFTTAGIPRPAPRAPELALPVDQASGLPLAVEFSWLEVRGAMRYELQLAQTDTPDSAAMLITVEGLAHTTLLPPSTEPWQWRVRAFTSQGTSEWSARRSFRTLDTTDRSLETPVPLLPEPGATLGADGTPNVRISWYDERADAMYHLQWVVNGTFSDTTVQDTIVRERMVVLTPAMAPGDLLRWRVMATTWWGESLWSEERTATCATTTATPPGIPQLVTPPDGASDVVRVPALTWSVVTQATGYRTEMSEDEQFTVTAQTFGVAGTGAQADTLEAGRRYWWRVRAENGIGLGEYSTTFSFVTGNGMVGIAEQPRTDVEAGTGAMATIVPNPATGNARVMLKEPLSTPTTIRIYRLDGSMALTGVLDAGQTALPLDMANEAAGAYILCLGTAGRILAIPFTILP